VITVFDDTQRTHAPREFIVSGRPQPIPERPERIDMLMEGVTRLGGPVVAPPEIFGDSIALVHERRYIQFLSTVWERWKRLPDAAETPSANVFALGRPSLPPTHYPDSVVGQCGWHLGDGSCPITAQTWAAARASADSQGPVRPGAYAGTAQTPTSGASLSSDPVNRFDQTLPQPPPIPSPATARLVTTDKQDRRSRQGSRRLTLSPSTFSGLPRLTTARAGKVSLQPVNPPL